MKKLLSIFILVVFLLSSLSFLSVSAEDEKTDMLKDELITMTKRAEGLRLALYDVTQIYVGNKKDVGNVYTLQNAYNMTKQEPLAFGIGWGGDIDNLPIDETWGEEWAKQVAVEEGLLSSQTQLLYWEMDDLNAPARDEWFFQVPDNITSANDIDKIWLRYYGNLDYSGFATDNPSSLMVEFEGKLYFGHLMTMENMQPYLEYDSAIMKTDGDDAATLYYGVSQWDQPGTVFYDGYYTIEYKRIESEWKIVGGSYYDLCKYDNGDVTPAYPTGDVSVFSVIAVSVSVLALGAVIYRRKRTI